MPCPVQKVVTNGKKSSLLSSFCIEYWFKSQSHDTVLMFIFYKKAGLRNLHPATSTKLLRRFWKSYGVNSTLVRQFWQFCQWRGEKNLIYLSSLRNPETQECSIYIRSVNAIKWYRVLTFALSLHPDVYELNERCLTTLHNDELNRCKVQKHNSIYSGAQWV